MYTKLLEVTLENLKRRSTCIQYFGLGFIQIKLEKEYRIHFYTSLLPAIIDKEDIHNHRYDFTSYILYGELHQEVFSLRDGDTHNLEEESCQEGYIPKKESGKLCRIEKLSEQYLIQGSYYTLDHKTFHRVTSTSAITFLKRGDYRKNLAEVVRPINGFKICPFSKKVSEEELWGIVADILSEAKKDISSQ